MQQRNTQEGVHQAIPPIQNPNQADIRGLAEATFDATFGFFNLKDHELFSPIKGFTKEADKAGAGLAGKIGFSEQEELWKQRGIALKKHYTGKAINEERETLLSSLEGQVASEEDKARLRALENLRNTQTGAPEAEHGARSEGRADYGERSLVGPTADNGRNIRSGSVASQYSPRGEGNLMDSLFDKGGNSSILISQRVHSSHDQRTGNLASDARQAIGRGGAIEDDDEELVRRLQQQLQYIDNQYIAVNRQHQQQLQDLNKKTITANRQLDKLTSQRQNPPHNFTSFTSLASSNGLTFQSKNFKNDIPNSFTIVGKKIKEMENANDEKMGLNIVTIEKANGQKGFMVDNKEINEMIIGHDVTEKNRKEMVYFSPASKDNYLRQQNELSKEIKDKINQFLEGTDSGKGFSNDDGEFKLQLNYLFKNVKTISDAKNTEFDKKIISLGKSQQDNQINKFFDDSGSSPKLQSLDENKEKLIEIFAKQIAKDGFKNNIDLDWDGNAQENKKSKISHISVSRPDLNGSSKKIDIKASGIYDNGMHHVTVHLENNIYAKFNFIDDGYGKYAFDNHIKYLQPNVKGGDLEEIIDPAKLIIAKKLIKGYKIDITTNAEDENKRYTQIRQNNTLPPYRLGYGTREPKIESRKKVESSEFFQFEANEDGIKCFTFGKTDPLTGYIGKHLDLEGVNVKIVNNNGKFELQFGENNNIKTKEHGWFYDRSINKINDSAKQEVKKVNLERKSQSSWGVTKRLGKLLGKESEDHIVIRAHDKDENKYYEFKIKKIQNPFFGLSKYDLKCTSISDSPKTFGHQSGGGMDVGGR